MSEQHRPRCENEDWDTHLHERTALLTLEDTGNYRATCRRSRDEVPQRLGKRPPPELYPYIVEFRQQKRCPDTGFWFETEPGCCFRVREGCMCDALLADQVTTAVLLSQIRGMRPHHLYVGKLQSVEMVRALYAAGVSFDRDIFHLFLETGDDQLDNVAEALKLGGIDINVQDRNFDEGPTLLHIAVYDNSVAKVDFVLQRHPDLSITDNFTETALQRAEHPEQWWPVEEMENSAQIVQRLRDYAAAQM